MYLHGYKIKNISEYLIKLRIRAGQTKSSKLKETLKNTISIQKKSHKTVMKCCHIEQNLHSIRANITHLTKQLGNAPL